VKNGTMVSVRNVRLGLKYNEGLFWLKVSGLSSGYM